MIDSLLNLHNGVVNDKIEKAISHIDDYLLSLNPPKDFSQSEDSAIRNLELSFEKLCASMEESGIHNPKSLTTFEFESKIDYLESKKVKR